MATAPLANAASMAPFSGSWEGMPRDCCRFSDGSTIDYHQYVTWEGPCGNIGDLCATVQYVYPDGSSCTSTWTKDERTEWAANCAIEHANGIPCLSMTETMVEENSSFCGSGGIGIQVSSCAEDRLYYTWSDNTWTHLSPAGTENPPRPDLRECQNFEDNPHRTRCQLQCYTCGDGYRKPCHENMFFCDCGCVNDAYSFEECVAVCPPFPTDWNAECVAMCASGCPAGDALSFS